MNEPIKKTITRKCRYCLKSFSRTDNLKRHETQTCEKKKIKCECGLSIAPSSLLRHKESGACLKQQAKKDVQIQIQVESQTNACKNKQIVDESGMVPNACGHTDHIDCQKKQIALSVIQNNDGT